MATITLTKTLIRLTSIDEGTQWDDSNITNSVNRIGERKRVRIDFTSSVPLDFANLYINLGLFLPIGYVNNIIDQGTAYWSIPLPDAFVAGDYICSYTNNSFAVNTNPAKNIRVIVRVIDATHFQIRAEFNQTYDIAAYLDSVTLDDNAKRFLKDLRSNANDLEASLPSVYTDPNIDGRVYIFIQRRDTLDKGNSEVSFGGYKAGFYDKGTHNATPAHINPVWKLFRNGLPVTQIFKNGNTDVELNIDGSGINIATAWLLRVDTNNNTVDYITNYEAEFAKLEPGTPNQSKMVAPFIAPTLIGASTYKTGFRIDPNTLVVGSLYRVLAVIYSSGFAQATSTLSPVFTVTSDFPYDNQGFDAHGRLSDYQREFSGNDLECVIEERMKSKLRLNFGGGKYAADILRRIGTTISNDIRRYLTDIDFKIYEEFISGPNTVRNVFDERNRTKINPIPQYSRGDIVMEFSTDSYLELSAQWRNRYESGVNCLYTLINGVNYGTFLSSQYWGGKNLFVEWKITFTYDDASSPFTDVIYFKQKLRIKDYSNDVQISSQIPADEDREFFCNDDLMCLKAALINPSLINYRLMNTIEVDPGSILTIEEAEAWAGDELAQLLTTKIFNQEVSYGQTNPLVAKFCINVSELLLDSPYKISAMAKKFYERCRRVTEHKDANGNFDELRKTEVNEQRVPEECAN